MLWADVNKSWLTSCCQLIMLCNLFGYHQSHKDNLHPSLVTAYWRLIILSWANSRLGVPGDCQSWLCLPDICYLFCYDFEKRVSRFWLVWVTLYWKSLKEVALWSAVYPSSFKGFLTLAGWTILCSGVRNKGMSMGYSEGLYLVKNQFVTA